MNCREFQKNIPAIINHTLPDRFIDDVLSHVDTCKECYDELEIYYVLQYGLGDDESKKSMDFVGQLETSLENMRKRSVHIKNFRSMYLFIYIVAHTSIIGSIIYILFKYFI